MAATREVLCSCLLLLIFHSFQVYAVKDGRAIITSKPDFLKFDENSESVLKVSEVQEVISASSGFSYHKDLHFDGLYASGPFDRVKGSAVIGLYGGDDVMSELEGISFKTELDEVYVPMHNMKHRMEKLYKDESIFVNLAHETTVRDLIDDNDVLMRGVNDDVKTILSAVSNIHPVTTLNVTDKEDFALLRQSGLIEQVLKQMALSKQFSQSQKTQCDVLTFELYVPAVKDTKKAKEITTLVSAVVEKVSEVMEQNYNKEALVIVLNMPRNNVVQSRKVRSILAEPVSASLAGMKVATAWTEDYPVMFHIILWTSVFMALLVIFASYGMASIDPGNDTIIYRMTTTRLKKD